MAAAVTREDEEAQRQQPPPSALAAGRGQGRGLAGAGPGGGGAKGGAGPGGRPPARSCRPSGWEGRWRPTRGARLGDLTLVNPQYTRLLHKIHFPALLCSNKGPHHLDLSFMELLHVEDLVTVYGENRYSFFLSKSTNPQGEHHEHMWAQTHTHPWTPTCRKVKFSLRVKK
ncbi:unnamed protein product [Nyctereutes procyonoides]|uniref:(raccoon dog) hypothetical protein n=1 Tax=Nyctereutes procyonoides TaxID=34880 RepID=A0A811YA20_NYCPR|nr:unnamed protein product [Nyctereutes procyonoides]